eukprot:scaffold52467_cov30-Tisochrysis_lutea.AAC.1
MRQRLGSHLPYAAEGPRDHGPLLPPHRPAVGGALSRQALEVEALLNGQWDAQASALRPEVQSLSLRSTSHWRLATSGQTRQEPRIRSLQPPRLRPLPPPGISPLAGRARVAAPMGMESLDESDLLYEEDLLRNAYSLKYWWRYMEAKRRSPPRQRNLVAERALAYLPGCFKIWHAYLDDRREQTKAKPPGHPAHLRVHAAYERALVYMCALALHTTAAPLPRERAAGGPTDGPWRTSAYPPFLATPHALIAGTRCRASGWTTSHSSLHSTCTPRRAALSTARSARCPLRSMTVSGSFT